jgi:hypothetical protein
MEKNNIFSIFFFSRGDVAGSAREATTWRWATKSWETKTTSAGA